MSIKFNDALELWSRSSSLEIFCSFIAHLTLVLVRRGGFASKPVTISSSSENVITHVVNVTMIWSTIKSFAWELDVSIDCDKKICSCAKQALISLTSSNTSSACLGASFALTTRVVSSDETLWEAPRSPRIDTVMLSGSIATSGLAPRRSALQCFPRQSPQLKIAHCIVTLKCCEIWYTHYLLMTCSAWILDIIVILKRRLGQTADCGAATAKRREWRYLSLKLVILPLDFRWAWPKSKIFEYYLPLWQSENCHHQKKPGPKTFIDLHPYYFRPTHLKTLEK